MGINGHNELLQIRKWRWFAVIATSNIVRGLALGIERTEEMGISKHTKETDIEKRIEEKGIEKHTEKKG